MARLVPPEVGRYGGWTGGMCAVGRGRRWRAAVPVRVAGPGRGAAARCDEARRRAGLDSFDDIVSICSLDQAYKTQRHPRPKSLTRIRADHTGLYTIDRRLARGGGHAHGTRRAQRSARPDHAECTARDDEPKGGGPHPTSFRACAPAPYPRHAHARVWTVGKIYFDHNARRKPHFTRSHHPNLHASWPASSGTIHPRRQRAVRGARCESGPGGRRGQLRPSSKRATRPHPRTPTRARQT